MFKLNIDVNNKNYNLVYIVVSSFLQHHRLEHVNSKKLYAMIRLNLLPYFDKADGKWTTYMLTKITKNSFKQFMNLQVMTLWSQIIWF